MPVIVPELGQSRLEVANSSGSNILVVVSFETGGRQFGSIQIAPGAKQIFSKFSRLVIAVTEGLNGVHVVNPSPLVVDVYNETPSERRFLVTLGVNQQNQFPLPAGEQLFLLPRVWPYIPPPPRITGAQYKRNNIFVNEDNEIELIWTYPPDHLAGIIGFNAYWAKYNGNVPVSFQTLNKEPLQNNHLTIRDFVVERQENHRYAITALAKNGVESLFSNIMVLDNSCIFRLIDAGYIPL